MGVVDKIKGWFSRGVIKKAVDKVVALSTEEVVKRVVERVQEDSEEAAKEKIQEVAAEVVREQIQLIEDPTGMVVRLGDKITEAAMPPITEKVWDRVKDKVVRKPAA